jgi:rRNA maturation endonuclease Nob1
MRMEMSVGLIIGLVVGALVVAGGIAWLVSWQRKKRKEEADAFYHMRCSGCNRRLRYRARQVGNKGKCSHCGKDLTFPPISMSVD